MLRVLSEVTTKLFPGCVDTVFVTDAYLCKRAVEKLIKTRESEQKQEKELREKVICAAEARGLHISTAGGPLWREVCI